MTQYVRDKIVAASAPPKHMVGAVAWIKANLFSSVFNTFLTILGAYLTVQLFYTLIDFAIIKAVWTGKDRDACLSEKVGREVGACWPYVYAKIGSFMTGFYKIEERYRVGITAIIGVIFLVPLLMPKVPYKAINALLFFVVYPFIAFYLLVGRIPFTTTLAYLCLIGSIGILIYTFFSPFRKKLLLITAAGLLVAFFVLFKMGLGALPHVEVSTWGGFLISMVVAITGIVVSLPIGIFLALGRRSKLPIIRYVCIGFIEFVRGVPLITVLFFATYMLPFFIPRSWNPDGLLRVLIGVSLFSAAYLAEIIRGGLQAIPKGQFEGAQALGLSYPKMMALVVLPQALKHVIPGIVNTFIGLFKDTTLVIIVSLLDLLGQLRSSFSDANWSTPSTFFTGFLFSGIIYFIFCYAMSRYSLFVEQRLNTGHKR